MLGAYQWSGPLALGGSPMKVGCNPYFELLSSGRKTVIRPEQPLVMG